MKLLTGESKILTSDSEEVVLTSHRIRFQTSNILISIMLDQVSGIQVDFTSKPIYLILAIAGGIGGVFTMNYSDGTIAILCFISAIVLVFLFIDSRKHVVLISSSSTKITFHTKGIGKDEVMNFVYKIEEAKNLFYLNK